VRTQEIVWADRLVGSIDDLLEAHSELAQQLAQAVHVAVFDAEMERVSTQPLPTLASYSLLTGGINLMHRASRAHFNRTQEVLEQLIERHGRIAAPRAWLANWYVLRGTRGLSDSRAHDAEQALAAARSALACDPSDARAMAIEGFVHCHLRKDLNNARHRCAQAIGVNPNCALAWLYMGAIEAFEGEGERAVDATQRALELSPIDPQRYYYESLAATAALAAQDHARAEALARSSLARNRLHSSTWRVLTIALVAQHRHAEAAQSLREVLQLEPDLTVERYVDRMPNGALAVGQGWASSLAAAGLPQRNASFQPRGELQ
jgi:tetratricopeptide (TPR) repeat protein